MSTKTKVLITGITGQIGQYVREVFESCDIKSCDIYEVRGISRQKIDNDPSIIVLDLCDTNALEKLLLEYRPDIIVHLAGISNLEECAADPIRAIEVNGHVTVNLCQIIYKNKLKCRLFNASSSEIYKGHISYTVKEDDEFYMPNHPYGISKLLGHSMVNYYRAVHNMPFSNGIIFTTESRRRTPAFLFKKVANHIKSWKAGSRTPITVGCLKSYRTLLHAYDVATAIEKICDQEVGDNYLICGDEHICVEDVVKEMFAVANIQIVATDTEITSADSTSIDRTSTDSTIIKIQGSLRGTVSSIHGNCEKIKKLGWSPKYTIRYICEDHLS
jgi:GDPmannose 4,6-dehydratase